MEMQQDKHFDHWDDYNVDLQYTKKPSHFQVKKYIQETTNETSSRDRFSLNRTWVHYLTPPQSFKRD